MPKFKDFFSKLREQGKIKSEAWDKFLEAVPEGEIPDEAVRSFEDSFLTLDRAVGHPSVNGTIRAQILDTFDNDFQKIIATLEGVDKETAEEIKGAMNGSRPNTFKRMELLTKTLPLVFEKVKTSKHGGDDDFKKKLSEKDNIIKEITDRVSKVQAEKEQREKELEEAYNKRFNQYILRSELEKLGSEYKLADAYEKNRSAVNKLVMSEILTANHLKLGEKEEGQYFIQVLDDKGAPRFDGNSPVTINSLLENHYKPYLKQSNADGDGGSGKNGQGNTRTFTNTGGDNNNGQQRRAPRSVAVQMRK